MVKFWDFSAIFEKTMGWGSQKTFPAGDQMRMWFLDWFIWFKCFICWKMHCRGVRGHTTTKNVQFSSDNMSVCRSKSCNDHHTSSSSDHKSFDADRRRSTWSGGEKPIKYNSINQSELNQKFYSRTTWIWILERSLLPN